MQKAESKNRTETLPFEKWHGTGNDFVICSERLVTAFSDDLAALARAMCDRRLGIGSDGLILIGKSETAEFRMRMWNPDGSESEMCANGLRCVGMHLMNHGLGSVSEPLPIETAKRIAILSFIQPPDWAEGDKLWVNVDMGIPVTKRSEIPMSGEGPSPVIEEELRVPGTRKKLKLTAVNFANPHAVAFVKDVGEVPLRHWGPEIENHTALFPERVNIEFVEVIAEDHVKMRVWERGAGETLSCGSGTAAVQAACVMTGKAGRRLRVDVPGGSLLTECMEDDHVFLSGPAVRVFTGEWYG